MREHHTLIIALLAALLFGGALGLLFEYWNRKSNRIMQIYGVSEASRREYVEAALSYGELLHERLNIKFEQIVITESHIYFKLAIAQRRPLSGSYESLLPYGVGVSELMSKEMCKELSELLGSRTHAHMNTQAEGAVWYSVHHEPALEPSYKPYLDILPEPQ